ncbi:MAG TPA: DUF3570 domain-containing protein [Fibrobacteria bacterium]|nr:DUF3570 domain-containing protein [Fibrobacteria bacterium]
MKHEYFWDRNGVWNHTPAFALKWALSRKWSFNWEQELDFVTGASRRLGMDKVGQMGDNGIDAVSGASKVELRHSENPGIAYASKGTVATASFYHSRENDYFSMSPAGSLSADFNERNTTVGVNWAEFFDDYRPQGAYAGMGGKKRIRSLGGTLAQSLTPLTLVGLTGTYINSWGYLGHPYNPPIDIHGVISAEAVPDKKTGVAVAGQIVQGYHIGDRLGSLNVDVRRFQDTWGIKSSTADVKLSQYFSEGSFVRLRVRYYNQTGAVFAKREYDGSELYRTADIRFFPFISYLLGAKLSFALPDSWGESVILPDRWDIKYDHMFRNTKGDPVGSAPGQTAPILYQLYGPDENYLQGVFMLGLVFNL